VTARGTQPPTSAGTATATLTTRIGAAARVRSVRYPLLAAAPAAAFGAVVAIAVLAPGDQRWPLIDTIVRASKVLALFGCLAGGLSFRRSEHLFKGWILLAATYALLVVRDAVIHRSLLIAVETPTARWIETAIIVTANLLGVLGSWTMARAWYVGGIELPGSRATRNIVRGAAVVMAVSITLPAFWLNAPHVADGAPAPIMGISDVVADALSISLIAPVLLTALALRGAAVVWPWALLTCSMFGWLCFDAIFSIHTVVTSGGEALRVIGEAFRTFAATGAAVAGIAQRLVATAPGSGTAARSAR